MKKMVGQAGDIFYIKWGERRKAISLLILQGLSDILRPFYNYYHSNNILVNREMCYSTSEILANSLSNCVKLKVIETQKRLS